VCLRGDSLAAADTDSIHVCTGVAIDAGRELARVATHRKGAPRGRAQLRRREAESLRGILAVDAHRFHVSGVVAKNPRDAVTARAS
jgi:hypothetical protein